MDLTAYSKWLRYTRTDDLAARYVETARSLECFLRSRGGLSLQSASPQDLIDFDATQDQQLEVKHWRYRHLDALFRFLENEPLRRTVQTLHAQFPTPARLELFRSIPLAHRRALAHLGIADNLQLLDHVHTRADQRRLARRAGIPVADLRALICIADLRRLVGLRRVHMLLAAGIDSVSAVAALSPEDLFQRVQDAHPKNRLDFGGYRHLPYQAGFLPDLVDEM